MLDFYYNSLKITRATLSTYLNIWKKLKSETLKINNYWMIFKLANKNILMQYKLKAL